MEKSSDLRDKAMMWWERLAKARVARHDYLVATGNSIMTPDEATLDEVIHAYYSSVSESHGSLSLDNKALRMWRDYVVDKVRRVDAMRGAGKFIATLDEPCLDELIIEYCVSVCIEDPVTATLSRINVAPKGDLYKVN